MDWKTQGTDRFQQDGVRTWLRLRERGAGTPLFGKPWEEEGGEREEAYVQQWGSFGWYDDDDVGTHEVTILLSNSIFYTVLDCCLFPFVSH